MCLLLVALLLSLCLFTSGWVVAPVSPSALKSQKSSSRAPRCAALWCTAAPDVAAEAADSNLQVEADVDADEAPSSYSTFRIDLEKPIGLLLDEIVRTQLRHSLLLHARKSSQALLSYF